MAETNISELFGIPQSHELPSNAGMALSLGLIFKRLGGSFSIASTGKRYVGRPFVCEHEDAIPQLPAVAPHERFLTLDQYEGGMRLLETLIHRLAKEDKDTLFDLFAPIAVDERKFTPSIEEPKRGAAC